MKRIKGKLPDGRTRLSRKLRGYKPPPPAPKPEPPPPPAPVVIDPVLQPFLDALNELIPAGDADLQTALEAFESRFDLGKLGKKQMQQLHQYLVQFNSNPEKAEAKGPEGWLQQFFPDTFSRPFTSYQHDFWTWGWDIDVTNIANRYRPRVECEPRGVGKSTSGESWVVMLLALKRAKTIGYLSRTDDKATQHFNAIKRKLENDTLLTAYPHLKPRIQRYRNSFSSWSQDRLLTDAGQMVIPITLMGSNRGFKSEDDVRFDVLILDDIDALGESPDVRAKNLEILKSEVLAAGHDRTLVLVLQNLVHRDSIVAMIMDHRADILSDREFKGPYPLMRWYDAEKILLDDGGQKWVITDGEVYDPAIGTDYCEALLNKFGKDTFDRECQQDVTKVADDKDFREWDEIYHVITWAELARALNQHGIKIKITADRYSIPMTWNVGEGFDFGTTREHPTAITFVARPDKSSPFDDAHFVFSEIVMPEFPFDPHIRAELVSPGRIARAIVEREKDLRLFDGQIKELRMSHEQSAAKNTMEQDLPPELTLHFNKWKARRGSGVPQIQNMLEIDRSKEHPFRRYPQGHPQAGQPLMGRPRIYFVVADDQGALYADNDGKLRVKGAVSDRGLARLRFEMPLFSSLNRGPAKINDDAVDSLRGLMSTFGVQSKGLSEHEQRERRLNPELQLPAIMTETHPDILQAKLQSRALYLTRMQAEADRAASSRRFQAPERIRFRR